MSNNKLLLMLVDYLIDKSQDTQATSSATIPKTNSTRENQVQDNDISSMFSDNFDDFVRKEKNTSSSPTPSQNDKKSSTQSKTKVTGTVFNSSNTQVSKKPNVEPTPSKDTKSSNKDFPDSFGDFDFD